MPNGAEIHESLDHALARPCALLRRGTFAAGRDGVIATLRAHGFELAAASARTEDELEASAPAWVFLFGMSMDDGYAMIVVPEAAIDEAARASAEVAERSSLDWGSHEHDPELYRAHMHLLALAGLREWRDVEHEAERLPDGLAFDEGTFAGWAGRWASGYDALTGARSGSGLDARITRVVHLFEHL